MQEPKSEQFVVERVSLRIGRDVTVGTLVTERARLAAEAVEKSPAGVRAELADMLRPGQTMMIHAVGSKEVADLVAEIYALDRVLRDRGWSSPGSR